MILKGKSRSGPLSLAAHLGNAETNERVTLIEARGTAAQDLRGALVEMDAIALGTHCQKPLYHAAISPQQPHRLTPEQRMEAIEALEKRLGFEGHQRVVVLHEKHGREHLHVVWSRIDLERMTAVTDSFNYRKHEEVARDLERRFGHDRVQGAHHEREGLHGIKVPRPDRTPSRAELRQEERTGIRGKDVKDHVTELFRASDGPGAFQTALEEAGYRLAQGDRRDFLVLDRAGGTHSLARRIDDVNAAQLRAFMAPIDPASLPSAEEAKRLQLEVKAWRNEQNELERQRRAAVADDKLEAAYGRGEDYVSQSTAAQRDFERRQRKLDRKDGRDSPWDRIEQGEARRKSDSDAERNERERQARESEEAVQPAPTSSPYDLGDIELTDAMRDRLDRLLSSSDSPDRSPGRETPDRQPGAPGGGRTRSR